MKNYFFLAMIVLIIMSFSSCATVLIKPQQIIPIETKKNDKVLLDEEEIDIKNNTIVLERDMMPKQLTIQREGYLDENIIVMQYRQPLKNLSPFLLAPVGMVWFFNSMSNFDTAGKNMLIGGGLILSPFLIRPIGPKSFSYTKLIEFPDNFTKIDYNKELFNDIRLNRVGVDLNSEDIQLFFVPKYSMYASGEELESTSFFEDIKIKETDFSYALNSMLKERGYTDTLQTALKNRFENSLLLDAEVVGYSFYVVQQHPIYANDEGLVKVEMDIVWKALNIYDEVIYEEKISSKSGEFALYSYEEDLLAIRRAMKDGMEHGLIELLSSEKLSEQIKKYSEDNKKEVLKNISLMSEKKYTSNLNEAISSSVTIKTQTGHGSGFLISSDGMILTNYHVVSNEEQNITVVLNNGEEKNAVLVQKSKEFDVALLDIEGSNYLPFQLSESTDFKIGQVVYAVGTPSAEDLAQSVSKGIISGLRKIPDTERKLIQTDASINTGNSGGALVDKQGVVYGIVSSKLYGIGVEGVGFAIPIKDALKAVRVLN